MDDDPSILEISKLMLMDLESNIDVDNACCVDEAFKKLSTGKYDVVISDYEMPQKNGLEFLKELREQQNDVAFIIFTGRGREDVAVNALNLGADLYLNKNGSPEAVYAELAHAIKNIVERKKSKQLLRMSESKYRLLVEKSLQGIMIAQTAPLRIAFANIAMEKMLGYKPEELASFSPTEVATLIHHEDRTVFFNRFKNRLEGKEADSSYEFRAVRKDGSIVWMEAFASEIEYNGQPAVQAMFLDIDERKKTEEMIKKSEVRYRELANFLPEIVFETDLSGKITFLSQTGFEILGYTSEDLEKGLDMLQFVLPEDREKVKENIRIRLTGKRTDNSEYTLFMKNGDTYPALVKTAPIFSENRLIGLRGLVIDITESKKAEQTIIESEKNYRSLINGMSDAVWVVDFNGNFVDVNDAAVKVLGYSRDELLSFGIKDVDKYMTPEQANAIMSRVASIGIQSFETVHTSKDGTEIPVEIISTPITYRGNPAVLGIARNISERKKAELELKQYNEVLEKVSEGIDAGLAVIDRDYRVVWANKRLSDLGVSPNKKCYETFNNLGIACPDCGVERVFLNNAPIDIHEYKTVNSKGETVWVELRVTPLKDPNGVTIAALELAVPITERKKAEQDLKESEEKYKTLFEQAGDYTLILEAQATGVPVIFDANSSALQIHGYTREEIIGKPITFIDEESGNKQVMDRVGKLLNNEKLTFETRHRRKDGSTIDVEVSIKKVKVGSKNFLVSVEHDVTERKKTEEVLRQERGMLESVTKNIGAGLVMISKDYKILWMNNFLRQFTGASENDHCYSAFNTCTSICPDCGPKKIFEGAAFDSREYYNQTEFNKDHPVWFELIATPIKDKDGNVVAALELTVNITAKKEAEKKLKENSDKIDLMNEKLRVVGSLTRHDVRNKLSAVTGYAYLLKKKHADEADVVEGLGKMEMAVRESMKIFDFAKIYEQLGVEDLVQIDVEAKVNEATTLFSGSLPKIINDCHGLTVLADSFLRQMFYNFIDNTRKYGQKTSIIKVHYQKTDKGNLELIYEDDGVGISAENKLKLFSEGFSTGGSTGFGLFLTKKMIEVYGWEITENGTPAEGARFTITIPKLSKNGKESYQITK